MSGFAIPTQSVFIHAFRITGDSNPFAIILPRLTSSMNHASNHGRLKPLLSFSLSISKALQARINVAREAE